MNLNIRIIESSKNFAEITVIRGASSLSHERSIYVGHIGETALCFYFTSWSTNN